MKVSRIGTWLFSSLCAGLLLFPATSAANAQQPASQDKAATYGEAWPMYGHDGAHTGRSAANGPNSADIKWTYDADGGVASPVVGTDGSVYLTTVIGTYHEQVVGLNPNGTEKWTLETTYGQYYYPTIGADGKVYVISNPPFVDDTLLALNPEDGSTAWSFPIGRDSIGTGFTWGSNSRPLVGPDGTIYLASAFGTAGYGTIFAINPNGTQKWTWDTSEDDLYCGDDTYLIYCSIESTPALAPNGILYVKPYGQGVIALNSATGEYLWRNNFEEGSGGADPFGQTLSVGPDSVAYTAEGNGRYNFYAINPDNSVKWVTETTAWNDQALSPLSADGTMVLRGDNEANFYAFNTSDGTNRWQLLDLTPGGTISGAPVLSANGMIYFTTGETTDTPAGTPGYLFAVRIDTGEIVWQYEVGFPDADLAMGADGTLFVPGYTDELGSVLYAFQCADGTCTLPTPSCPDPNNISTEADLSNCIQRANIQAGPQTLRLGANITLTERLPIILSEIVLDGKGHFLSGCNALPALQVNEPGNLTLSDITIKNSRNDFRGFNGDAGSIYEGLGYGGGLYNYAGMATILNSTFSGNSVNSEWYGGGGGIYNSGTMTVVNSTFSGNTASNSSWGDLSGRDGGAVYNNGTMTVVNSTFSGNSSIDAFGSGGAIYNNGLLNLKNSILANSTGYGDCYTTVALASNLHNLIESGYTCGTPFSSSDPGLGPLTDNGGFTKTFAVPMSSPAFDAGDDATCATAPVNNLDQRGVARPQGAHCDIGAFELEVMNPFISGNAGVGNATMNYTGGSIIADDNGSYRIMVLPGWSGTVTPAKTGYTFSPPNRSYTNLTMDQEDQDYTASMNTYSISGNAGIAGASLTYTGGSTTTDGSGHYNFTVHYGWTGTVTPSKNGYIFDPDHRDYADVTADQANQDYNASGVYKVYLPMVIR
jgi:outer membrane protein assembly factor BamB